MGMGGRGTVPPHDGHSAAKLTRSDAAILLARRICDENKWFLPDWIPEGVRWRLGGLLSELEPAMGIHWSREGTREQIVIALCLLAAILQR